MNKSRLYKNIYLFRANDFLQGVFGEYVSIKDKDNYVNKGTKESVKSNIGGILPNTIICERVF